MDQKTLIYRQNTLSPQLISIPANATACTGRVLQSRKCCLLTIAHHSQGLHAEIYAHMLLFLKRFRILLKIIRYLSKKFNLLSEMGPYLLINLYSIILLVNFLSIENPKFGCFIFRMLNIETDFKLRKGLPMQLVY